MAMKKRKGADKSVVIKKAPVELNHEDAIGEVIAGNHKLIDGEMKIADFIKYIPYAISIYDLDGKQLICNDSFLKLFRIAPPKEYSIFHDPLLKKYGLDKLIQKVKDGEIIKSPVIAYNLIEIDSNLPDNPLMVTVVGFPLYDLNHNVEKIVLIHTDKTKVIAERIARKESESRLKEFFDNMIECVAVYEVKNNGRDIIIKDFNKSAEMLDKVNKNDIIGKKVDEVFTGIKKMGLYDLLIKVWKTGKSMHHPMSFYTDEFHKGWRDNFVFKLPSGEVVAIYSDVTEKMEFQERLKESESKYKTLVENANSIVLRMDKFGKLIFANNYALDFFGYTSKELLGKDVNIIVPAKIDGGISGPKLVKDILDNPDEFSEYINQNIKKNGELVWVSWRNKSILGSKGEIIGNLAIGQDITKQKNSENALKASELRYRRLFESAKDGILILDEGTGVIVDSNPYIQDLLGYSKAEINGKEIWQISPFKDIFANKEKFIELQKKGHVHYEDLPLETKAGKKAHVEFVSNVYEVEGKKVIQCNIRDITDRKNAEKAGQLEIINKNLLDVNATKTEFLNLISHELKTPLTAMSAHLEVLGTKNLNLTERQVNSIAALRRNKIQLRNLIENLLEISRLESGKLELNYTKFDLEFLIRNIIENMIILSSKKKLEIITHIEKLPEITADRMRVEEIIINLLMNAIKFTEKGTITLSAIIENDNVIVSVKDTGIGIDPKNQKYLFGRFYQVDTSLSRKGSGTGLGLSIVKRLVELHHGRISVESKLGEGSTFTFSIPIMGKREV